MQSIYIYIYPRKSLYKVGIDRESTNQQDDSSTRFSFLTSCHFDVPSGNEKWQIFTNMLKYVSVKLPSGNEKWQMDNRQSPMDDNPIQCPWGISRQPIAA